MDNFYYNLLNINQQNYSVGSTSKVIENIIKLEMNKIKEHTTSLEGLCKVAGYNIGDTLANNNLNVHYLNIKEIVDSIDHLFIVVDIKDDEKIKYFLIDPTYIQFLKTSEFINPALKDYPSEVLKKTIIGEKILYNLVNKNYMEIDDDEFKIYLGSFINEFDKTKINIKIEDLIFKIKSK